MSYLRIGAGGSAADPSHKSHLAVVKEVVYSGLFDIVFWILSGFSESKPTLYSIKHHRVAMAHLTIPSSLLLHPTTRLIISYEDVYGPNTPSIDVIQRIQEEFKTPDVTWFTGADSVVLKNGKTEIERNWVNGKELITNHKFLIFPRKNYPHPRDLNLSSNFSWLDVNIPEISSSHIRQLILDGNPAWKSMVTPEVAAYIQKHKLYGYQAEKEN